MIKFTADTKGGAKLVGFGISEQNVNRLRRGQPIRIDLAEVGLGEGSLTIFYGKTERDLVDAVAPFIGPDTIVNPED